MMSTLEQSTPQRIGRYAIQEELGRGAMGVVYKALDPAIGRTIAVKSIRIGEISDPKERQRIRDRIFREAQSAGVLSHPYIVTIYDIQEEDSVAYIFMEFIEGSTLERILLNESSPPPKEFILNLFRQTAEALDFAHSKGIVHRDIKPANIMVRKDWTSKIADFGIARIESQSMTQTGLVMGTPNYMAPEQIQGKHVDGRSDQFSLAVMAYEVLTGEKPFVADSLPTLLFKVVAEPPMPVVRLNPTLDPGIDAVLQRALSKNPADRFETCVAFLSALEDACRRNPGWTTQSRGAGQTAPTEALPAVAPAVATPVAAPVAAPVTPAPTPAPKPAPAPAPAAAPVPVAPAISASPAPVRRTEAPAAPAAPVAPAPPAKGGNMLPLLAGALLGLAAFGFGVWKFTGRKEAPAPPPETPVASNDVPIAPPLPKMGNQSAPDAPVTRPVATPPVTTGGSNPAPAPAAGPAVEIRSNPPGANVVIDDGKQAPCTTPCQLDLAAGRHTLIAQLDTYETANRIFNLPQDSRITIDLRKQTGRLAITSSPAGATISVDGNDFPDRTPALVTLPVGRHRIRVSLPGFPERIRELDIRDGMSAEFNINFNGGN